MKTRIYALPFSLILFLLLFFPTQAQEAKKMLQDTTVQNEVMGQICSNRPMMNRMMDHMMKNDQAMEMMRQNREMMDSLNGGGKEAMMEDRQMMKNMMQMAERDSAMCGRMMNMMMNNTQMMEMMMNNPEMMEKMQEMRQEKRKRHQGRKGR